ncbi:hypothetical protein QY97_04014 [Bacillus thermotolerans]|uniref:Uncharacterized protein n=1 Tax=Bacillus thermotolerans TaxID=1221996 RepID=A0A0F5HI66_BACTR|nr:hypothetical protein QY97_04014 [Bacillus thermotolerans]KKB36693.1 hypothetical protein QY95_02961 [Bacillus thermotolerans]
MPAEFTKGNASFLLKSGNGAFSMEKRVTINLKASEIPSLFGSWLIK